MRRTFVGLVATALIGTGFLAGCDGGSGGTTKPTEGHDGQSATGHTGKMPAGGPDSPEGKAAAKKAAAAK